MNDYKNRYEEYLDSNYGPKELCEEIDKLRASLASAEEAIDRNEEDNKDLAGEIELYQRENGELRTKQKVYLEQLKAAEGIVKENERLKKGIVDKLKVELDKTIISEKDALQAKIDNIKNYLIFDIPHELQNEATNRIYSML